MSDNIELTVPAEYAYHFELEALATLEYAGGDVAEGTVWARQGKGNPDRLAHRDLPRLLEATTLCGQLGQQGEGDLTVKAEHETVRTTVVGCLLDCGERVGTLAESVDYSGLRAATTELDHWLGQLEMLDAIEAS